MPALPLLGLLLDVPTLVAAQTNVSSPVGISEGSELQVICAWPVSGQYGPGSRYLYYVLIGACLFARNVEWLRHAFLAAALILPAVAALHGIALAAVHVPNAVDMDVFGAFQLCIISILAAPVTVRLSRTYFNTRGRNVIFIWAGLILAGLLSLTVEFFRIDTVGCTRTQHGAPISSNPRKFPYGETCGLICDTTSQGPYSPMRRGSANNIYVIPAPDNLTFGTATLIAAGGCIHTILWLLSMLDRILELNSKENEEKIKGTNGATWKTMRHVDDKVTFKLGIAVIPIFGGAGLTMLIFGEINFFSPQVRYQTEPMASIGQWSSIVATGLAVFGSLYVYMAKKVEIVKKESEHTPPPDDNPRRISQQGSLMSKAPLPSGLEITVSHDDYAPGYLSTSPVQEEEEESFPNVEDSDSSTHSLTPTTSANDPESEKPEEPLDPGNRLRVAEAFVAAGKWLGSAMADYADQSEFRNGPAMGYPAVPSEDKRRPDFQGTCDNYDNLLQQAGTPRIGSRGNSCDGRSVSDAGVGPSTLYSSTSDRPRSNTMPVQRRAYKPRNSGSQSPSGSPRGRSPGRRNTLEVPTSRDYFLFRRRSSGPPLSPV